MNVSDDTIPIQPAPSPAAPVEEVALFEIRRKIYPRAVHGTFARWRWALIVLTQLIFYGLPWLTWNDRQAVLFDLAARKFYIFGLVFWPQDVIYLAVLLILSALSLFLFTAIAGRVWCGYACPQTVYTEIFLWVERRIEGDRVARIRLDAAPLSASKIAKKAGKHASWLALSLWTGLSFVGYFTPIKELIVALPGRLGPWETFWVLFYGLATYGNAGWMREQVCKYMCPYARFQSVMFDQDTMIIAYDSARGEPRGARRRDADIQAAGLGHCIACNVCVQVCPTGIDIRKGLQYECIGCAACIDGCDQVMDRMGYPPGLIRYASQNGLAKGYDRATTWKRAFRLRTLLYLALLSVVATAAGVALYLREPLKVDVMRDRGSLAREAKPGVIENAYRIQIMNTDEKPRQFRIGATGLPGIAVVGVEQPVAVGAASTRLVPIGVQVPTEAGDEDDHRDEHKDEHRDEHRDDHEGKHERHRQSSHRIEITVEAVDEPTLARHEKSTFLFPR